MVENSGHWHYLTEKIIGLEGLQTRRGHKRPWLSALLYLASANYLHRVRPASEDGSELPLDDVVVDVGQLEPGPQAAVARPRAQVARVVAPGLVLVLVVEQPV